MKQTVEDKRKKEKQVVATMIEIYCRHHHGTALCSKCSSLLEYAHSRIDHCPMMEKKTFCSQCKIHCYAPVQREKIRSVMRYSGPRMLFYHPVLAISHLYEERKAKRCSTKD